MHMLRAKIVIAPWLLVLKKSEAPERCWGNFLGPYTMPTPKDDSGGKVWQHG